MYIHDLQSFIVCVYKFMGLGSFLVFSMKFQSTVGIEAGIFKFTNINFFDTHYIFSSAY